LQLRLPITATSRASAATAIPVAARRGDAYFQMISVLAAKREQIAMMERAPALDPERGQPADRRRLLRLLLGAGCALPASTIAACAGTRPDWEPNWRRGTTAKGGNRGRNGGGRSGGGSGGGGPGR
jgi:uncharacterized membrane protein YgcG